jgi:hypothetical protein
MRLRGVGCGNGFYDPDALIARFGSTTLKAEVPGTALRDRWPGGG